MIIIAQTKGTKILIIHFLIPLTFLVKIKIIIKEAKYPKINEIIKVSKIIPIPFAMPSAKPLSI